MQWKLSQEAGAVARLAGLLLVTCVLVLPSANAQCIPEEVVKLVANDGQPGEAFGLAVAIDRDVLVIGAPSDDENGPDSGSAYIFERQRHGIPEWEQVAKLIASDGAPMDRFGHSVAISGRTVIVGAVGDDNSGPDSGSAYIFEHDWGGLGKWGQVVKLLSSDGAASDSLGVSVSAYGDTCVVGAYLDDHIVQKAGSAYVFERNRGGPDKWGESAKLVASGAAIGDEFGGTVAIWKDTIIVGAMGDSESALRAGAAFIFERESEVAGTWSQVAKLRASDGTGGDQFGTVAIDGDTVIVGALSDDENGMSAGSAYVFERDRDGPDRWKEVRKILPADGGPPDQFGQSVSISGDTAVIGAPRDFDLGTAYGAAYVFHRDLNGKDQWGQLAELHPSDAGAWDSFGYVSISGETMTVGAPKGFVPGAVYVYEDKLLHPPKTYCTAKPASIPGCVPSVQGVGIASATGSSGFTVSSGSIPGQSTGMFFYTHCGTGAVRRSQFGTLCVSSFELHQTPPQFSGGSLGQCNGLIAFDWNAFAQSVMLTDPTSTTPGATVDGQFWYRDPSNPGGGNLTDAIAFVVCR